MSLGATFILLVKNEYLICERGCRALSENVQKSIGCELKSPQNDRLDKS